MITNNNLSKALLLLGYEIQKNKLSHGWKLTSRRDWEDDHEIPAVLMLITTEVAKAMEAFRHNDFDNFKEELADIIIRVVGLAHEMGISLDKAIEHKMRENRTREHKHGGKRI